MQKMIVVGFSTARFTKVHGWVSPQGQYEPAAKRLYAKYYRYGYGASDVSGQT